MAKPARSKFGFGDKLAIVNVDLQNAYARMDEFGSTCETDPRQIEYVNAISDLARSKGMPVIWTHVAWAQDASDAGVWGTPTILQIRFRTLSTAAAATPSMSVAG